jgi:hypothetical protein
MTFPKTLDTKAWMPHILATLRHLGPRGEEVRFRDVITHIESLAGFPGWDTWGTKMKRGKPYFAGHRAVTLAGGRLKKDGMVVNPRRGYYSLAPDLRNDTPEVTPERTPEVTPERTPEVTPVEVEQEDLDAMKVEITRADDGECYLPPETATTHESYAVEADLRKAAIDQTRCFGSWSPRSSQCGGCPLAGLCQTSTVAVLASVAAYLDEEYAARVDDAHAALANERERLVAVLREVATPMSPEEEVVKATPSAEYSTVVVPFACVCSAANCKQPEGTISANTTAAHVEGKGVFHIGCV